MSTPGNILTDAKIKGLKAPAKNRLEFADDKVPGLRVRVSARGNKCFILRKRQGDKVHNITLGTYGPRFGLASARAKARALLNDLEAGNGLPTPRALPRSAPQTINAMIPQYLESKIGLRSHREIKRVLEGYVVPKLGDRLADSVTRGQVTALIDEIAATAPTMARGVLAQLSAFYTWAMPRLDLLPANPCRDAGRPPKPKARDRVLSDVELAALWHVAEQEALPWGAGLKLLILTGARREEVFSADLSEFDKRSGEWIIAPARAKNGVAHLIPLTKMARDVLAKVPKVKGSPKLFPTRTKSGQADRGPSGFSKAQARFRDALDEALGRAAGEHWTLHDIRRTVATGLQKLGVRFEVTEAVLNHVSGAKGGIAGVYQRHDWKPEKRQALQAWSVHLQGLIAKAKKPPRAYGSQKKKPGATSRQRRVGT